MNGCDEEGGPREFVSSGLSAEEVHRLTSCRPDGLRLFESLRDQEATLRLEDFPGHIRALGLSGELGHCRNFQDTPIRRRGAREFESIRFRLDYRPFRAGSESARKPTPLRFVS